MMGILVTVRCFLRTITCIGVCAGLYAADSISDQIRSAQSSGNYALAATLYLQLIAGGTDSPEIRSNCGVMLHLAGKNRAALEQFRVALDQKPGLAAANLFAGMSEFDLGEPKAALPYLIKARQLDPAHATPLIALGKVYVAVRDYGRANEMYKQATALDPTLAEAWYGLGVTDRSLAEHILNEAARKGEARTAAKTEAVQNLLNDAVQALTRSAELDPNSARTHLLMAESLSEGGKQVEAVPEYEAAIKLDPDLAAAYIGLASEYWKQRQFDQALPLLKHVLARSPKDPEANAMMADITEHNGDVKNAERYAETALSGNPDLIQTRIVLARVYLSERQPRSAIAEIQKVISADTDGSYHFLLYRAYREAGDEQSARRAMAEFQQIRYGATAKQ